MRRLHDSDVLQPTIDHITICYRPFRNSRGRVLPPRICPVLRGQRWLGVKVTQPSSHLRWTTFQAGSFLGRLLLVGWNHWVSSHGSCGKASTASAHQP